MSQSLTVLSSDPDAMSLESGENTPVLTQFWWPIKELKNRLDSVLNNLINLSSELVSSKLPSELKLTSRTAMVCALMEECFPSTQFFQMLTVQSSEPEATRVPLGCIDRQVTAFVCADHLKGRMECLKFQTLIVQSFEAETTCLRDGLKHTEFISALCPLKHLFKVGSD